MGRTDHGAVPARGHERAPTNAPGDERGSRPITFGPGLGFYALPPLLVLFGGGLFYAGLRAPDLDVFTMTVALCLVLVGLVFPFVAWVRYRLDDEGIQRHTLGSRRGWRWEDVGRVHGVEVEVHGGLARGETLASRHSQTLVRRTVHDSEGRTLFRISPWTRSARKLSSLIRRRSTG